MSKVDEDGIEEQIAENIALVEYYYGVCITPDFPVMKRLNMQEQLKNFIKIDFENTSGAVNTAIVRSFK